MKYGKALRENDEERGGEEGRKERERKKENWKQGEGLRG